MCKGPIVELLSVVVLAFFLIFFFRLAFGGEVIVADLDLDLPLVDAEHLRLDDNGLRGVRDLDCRFLYAELV